MVGLNHWGHIEELDEFDIKYDTKVNGCDRLEQHIFICLGSLAIEV